MKYSKQYFVNRGYNFKQDIRRFYLLALTLKYLSIKRVLDVGCAYGALVYVLRKLGIEAFGIDISEWAKNISPVNKYILLEDLNKDSVPFNNEYFDCIIAINFFEHIKKLSYCMREVYRILKRGGMLYVSIPLYSEETLKDPYHVSIFPLKIWLRMFISHGFKLSFMLCANFWLHFAISWLRTLLQSSRGHKMSMSSSRKLYRKREGFPLRLLLWLRQSYRLVFKR